MATKNNNKAFIPKPIIALSYSDVFDTDNIDIISYLKNVPTIVLLNYVITKQLKIHFTYFASLIHNEEINELSKILPQKNRKKIIAFKRKYYNNAILYNIESTLHICYESLRNYVSIKDGDDKDINATEEELNLINKAYLKCNEEWNTEILEDADPINTFILLDAPTSEFKFYKDFKPAVYKSIRFFKFFETNVDFNGYLNAFCSDLKVRDWREYLALLINLYKPAISSPYVDFRGINVSVIQFYKRFIFDVSNVQNLGEWNRIGGLKYLRDHFIVMTSNSSCLILSPDFIVDKMYQGLKFMMFESIVKHKLCHTNGKPFKDLSEFNALLGDKFSEDNLLKPIIEKSLKVHSDVFLSKEEMHETNLTGETDFYIRYGTDLIMIEYKDVIISDKTKNSGDVEKIKEAIFDRICKYTNKKKKGVGQLFYNIESLRKGDYRSLDKDSTKVKRVFPIIVTTDPIFSSIGVNAAIIKEAASILNDNNLNFGKMFVSIPIIIDIDTIINIAYDLSIGKLNIIKLLESYLKNNLKNLLPFKIYIMDRVLKESEVSRKENIFLFGEEFI